MASNTADLVQIAEEILAATKTVSQFLSSNGHPSPSFAADAPRAFPDAPEDVQAARMTLRTLTNKLDQLVTGPHEVVISLIHRDMEMAALRYIYHFKIHLAVPLEGEISFEDIAEKTGLSLGQMRRIVRLVMTYGLFLEPRIGFVCHSAASAILATDKKAQDYIGHDVEFSYHVNAKLVEAVEKWGDDGEMSHTALNVAFDTPLPFYHYMVTHEDPNVVQRFHGLMGALQAGEDYSVNHVVKGYDWASVGDGTVVDIGGGTGDIAIGIAKEFPDIKFIVQDLPHVAGLGKAALPADLASRIDLVGHDFFTPQTVAADVHMARFILHNYSDKDAIRILRGLVPVLKNGSKVVVIDAIMPPPKTLPLPIEQGARIMDLIMLTHCNALERELEDWHALFTAADPRFKLKNVSTPAGSALSVLEVVFEE